MIPPRVIVALPLHSIFFWIDLGHFLVRSVNESFASEELSPTFKQGVTCIPKGNKDKLFLKKLETHIPSKRLL